MVSPTKRLATVPTPKSERITRSVTSATLLPIDHMLKSITFRKLEPDSNVGQYFMKIDLK